MTLVPESVRVLAAEHPLATALLLNLLKVGVLFNGLLLVFSLMTWVERRLLAFMQFRLGPNRTGPFGILQPLADGIKLFFKEELMPIGANAPMFLAAPLVGILTAFLAIAVVPYGSITIGGETYTLQIADLEVGVLYLFAVTSLSVYAIVMAGWAANNKYQLIGGLRSSAQMFSYELALGLSFVGLIMSAESFKITDIVNTQYGGIWMWNIWPWRQGIAFFVYFIAACAEVNRTPFDLPEAETELVAGFHTEYSSMRFALLQMAEYVNMITASAVAANLFLGGWHSPLPPMVPLLGMSGPHWFVLKVGFFLFVFIWLRGTVPRLRYDQLMHFGWKVLVPLATVNIIVMATVMVLFGGGGAR